MFLLFIFSIELYIWSWPTQKTLNRRRKVKNFSPQKGIKLTSASVKVISGEHFMCRQPPENTNNRMFKCRSHRCFTGGRLLKLILWGSINCDTLNIGSSKHIKKNLLQNQNWSLWRRFAPQHLLLFFFIMPIANCAIACRKTRPITQQQPNQSFPLCAFLVPHNHHSVPHNHTTTTQPPHNHHIHAMSPYCKNNLGWNRC